MISREDQQDNVPLDKTTRPTGSTLEEGYRPYEWITVILDTAKGQSAGPEHEMCASSAQGCIRREEAFAFSSPGRY